MNYLLYGILCINVGSGMRVTRVNGMTFSRREKKYARKEKKSNTRIKLILEEGFLEHLEGRLLDSAHTSHPATLSERDILNMVAVKAVALIEVLWDPKHRIAVRYVESKERIERAFRARTTSKPLPEKPLHFTQRFKLLASKVLTHKGPVTPPIRHFPPSPEQ